jgi:hypothetical protein
MVVSQPVTWVGWAAMLADLDDTDGRIARVIRVQPPVSTPISVTESRHRDWNPAPCLRVETGAGSRTLGRL